MVTLFKQHFLYFFPLPQGQGWLRPIFIAYPYLALPKVYRIQAARKTGLYLGMTSVLVSAFF
jgi:hypothetical protein